MAVFVGAGVLVDVGVFVLVTVGVVHPLMVRLSADDDLLPHLVVRTLTQADAYDPLPTVGGAGRKPNPSVPAP